MFRKLLIDASLGAIQPIKVPYKSLDLPLSKITELCKKIMETETRTIEEIRKKELFNDILEATNHAVKFLRMLTLKMENFQIENNEEGSEEENNIIVEENAHYDIQDTITEEGTDDEEESNEEK